MYIAMSFILFANRHAGSLKFYRLYTGVILLVCLSLIHAAPKNLAELIADIQYQNQYDQRLLAYCHGGAGMYQVQSVYSDGARDRVWSWQCKNLKMNAYNSQCANTDYVNNFDEPMYFMCGSDQYIAGVDSYHNNWREDRRWRFTCCSVRDLKIYSCRLTGYVNDFNQPLNFQAYPDEVITGVYGYHDNERE